MWPPTRSALGPGAVITTFGYQNSTAAGVASGWASTAWPSANRAYYYPVVVAVPVVVTKLFVANGATASGNLDVGLYTVDGTRLLSTGSTAQAGTAAIQAVDVTDTLIGAGLYYLALSHSNTVGTYMRVSLNANLKRLHGVMQQASALPLPATATFATAAGSYLAPVGMLCAPRTVI